MFSRNKISLVFLFSIFIVLIILHFSFPELIQKEPKDVDIAEKQLYHTDFSSEIIGKWSDVSDQIEHQNHLIINQNFPFSSTLVLSTDENQLKGKQIKIAANGFSKQQINDLFAVLSVEKKDNKIYYRAFPLNIKTRKWFNYRFEEKLPEDIPEGSVLKYYLWNKSDTPFFIDELSLEIN